MKSTISIPMGILLGISLYACTAEPVKMHDTDSAKIIAQKLISMPAAHKGNPHDIVGVSYRDLLLNYKAGGYVPSDFADIDAVVHSLMNTPGSTSATAKQMLLASCVNDPLGTLNNVLSESGVSTEAAMLLSELIESYEALGRLPFGDAYAEIVVIEDVALLSPTLSEAEQRTILSVASVMRFSLYHSCCTDTDWGKSVGNIVAAAAGAVTSEQLALEYIMITSIAGLEKVQL